MPRAEMNVNHARPGSLGAWILAARPATLTAAFVPVAVGTAVAAAVGAFRAGPALAALLGAMAIQIGTNFANDVFDYEKGADTSERLGPTRAVQAGLLSPRAMRLGMFVAFAVSILAGVYLTAVAGPVIIVIGVASILSGIAYTGGPYPLGYHGLGDFFVLVFFGFVAVCGTAFVQVGEIPVLAFWASFPIGALATAILAVNNLRDRVTDARAGKRTLAVRLGRGPVVAEYVFLLVSSYLVPLGFFAFGGFSPWVLLPLASTPLAILLARRLIHDEGPRLNQSLVGTARLLAIFGVLFALGVVLGAP